MTPFNQRQQHNEDIGKPKRNPLGSPKLDQKQQPFDKKQNHILVEMKHKYGRDFIDAADANREFDNKYKINNLIRQIFSGKVDLYEYGVYLFNPKLNSKIIDLAKSMFYQTTAHSIAMQMLLWNKQNVQPSLLPVPDSELIQLAAYDSDLQRAWAIVLEGVSSLSVYNTLDILVSTINKMRNEYCADGQTRLCLLL